MLSQKAIIENSVKKFGVVVIKDVGEDVHYAHYKADRKHGMTIATPKLDKLPHDHLEYYRKHPLEYVKSGNDEPNLA